MDPVPLDLSGAMEAVDLPAQKHELAIDPADDATAAALVVDSS